MSATLVANIYGVQMPVHRIVEYNEYEFRIGNGDWQRSQVADIVLDFDHNWVLHSVPLHDLLIVNEPCDICDALPYGACDRHAK